MEQSILTSTKKILGLGENYTAFDHDICTHINSTFSTLSQLGIMLPTAVMQVEDSSPTWDDLIEMLEIPSNEVLGLVKNYVYLKVRMLFDPPGTSFLIAAMDKQIAEQEWRLNHAREMVSWTAPIPEEEAV